MQKIIEVTIQSELDAIISIEYIRSQNTKTKLFFSKPQKESIFSREYVEKINRNEIHLEIALSTSRNALLISGGRYNFNDSFDAGYSCTVHFKAQDDVLKDIVNQTLRENKFGVFPTARLTVHSHLNDPHPTHSKAQELLSRLIEQIKTKISI